MRSQATRPAWLCRESVRGNEKEQQSWQSDEQQGVRFLSVRYTKARLAKQVCSLSIALLTPMEFSPRSSLLRRQVEQEPWSSGRAWYRAGPIRSPDKVYRRC